MNKTFKIEQLLPLIGLGATSLLVLGIFYSSGQASIVGDAYLRSFTYTDTLIQAFEPLKQLVFLAASMVFVFFLSLILLFIIIWVFTIFDLFWALTISQRGIKKKNLEFQKLEEALHVATISAATKKQPNLHNLLTLEHRFVLLQRWRKSKAAAKKAREDYIVLLRDLISGRWYKLESNKDNNGSIDTLLSIMKANRYKIGFNSAFSVLVVSASLIIFTIQKYQTETIYLSWLFITLLYMIIFAILRIAKFANTKDKTPHPSEKGVGYLMIGPIVLSFMFLLGRDDVQAKSRLEQYITVEHIKGNSKCGRNLAGNSTILVIEDQNGIVLIPWRHIEGVSYSPKPCSPIDKR